MRRHRKCCLTTHRFPCPIPGPQERLQAAASGQREKAHPQRGHQAPTYQAAQRAFQPAEQRPRLPGGRCPLTMRPPKPEHPDRFRLPAAARPWMLPPQQGPLQEQEFPQSEAPPGLRRLAAGTQLAVREAGRAAGRRRSEDRKQVGVPVRAQEQHRLQGLRQPARHPLSRRRRLQPGELTQWRPFPREPLGPPPERRRSGCPQVRKPGLPRAARAQELPKGRPGNPKEPVRQRP
ncbi:hypothetical protein FBY30_0163 [Arthrobacter sp. SLBN-83]|nr:hypothetical protein FBY30_0163 [Arthrobacter sp. SLBN-83]